MPGVTGQALVILSLNCCGQVLNHNCRYEYYDKAHCVIVQYNLHGGGGGGGGL